MKIDSYFNAPIPHVFVPKKWGGEKHIHNCGLYCGKILYFQKHLSCSYHYHKLKTETFYIHEGRLLVEHSREDDIMTTSSTILEPGDSFEVPVGLRHRMTGLLDTVMFEFSTHDDPNDSYRIIPS